MNYPETPHAVPPSQIQQLLTNSTANGHVVELKSGKSFFVQGDAADSIYYLLEGRAKIVVVSAEGKEAVIGTISENDFFGEQCLNGHIKRIATTIALADCVTVRAPKAGFVALLHVEPEFSEFFITYLLSRSARTEDDLIDHLFNSSEKRLARLLLILSNFGKDAPPEPVLETISQETLAQMIGTTRSRVNTFMNKFRRLGFIDYNGGVQVRRSLLNVVLRD